MSARTVKRVVLMAPPVQGKTRKRRFEAPVYAERNGLALHQVWGVDGPAVSGPFFALSALPVGYSVARFWDFDEAEAAFYELVDAVDWRRIGPNGFRRYRKEVREVIADVLARHKAVR
jgi:hypothetical protein